MRKGYFITSDESSDLFVGIRFVDGKPQVVVPHGFNISDDEHEQRKDAFRLLSVLKKFSTHKDGDATDKNSSLPTFPLSSYQYIIYDFLQHGYYTEREVKYIKSLRGKINWKRTIQKEKPQLDEDNVVYLSFQTKTSQVNDDNLITQIHKYCVYQSLLRFGWLFLSTDCLPKEPSLKINKSFFIRTLKRATNNTFDDKKRKLFESMINVILDVNEEADIKNLSIGVNGFELVWERLIDFVFGEADKEKYFPHGTWFIIKDGSLEKSSALVPDTIMKYDGKFYILDAKYYKYGITNRAEDLPQTSSIQKQITYGKHILQNFPNEVSDNQLYNAFIMPFNGNNKDTYKFASVGSADCEEYSVNTKNYAYVLGILVDTKWLISEYVKHNDYEIENLSKLIEESLSSFRKSIELNNE